ncbi:MAG: hypothetical protein AUK63_2084 [bacterium P3]|nr:MAG: hypothetical protein AUK63_2084 [bacterium P3]
MINLSVLNKALTDRNVSDAEFRLLYMIANNISMGETATKEIYNGFLMDKLNKSERQTQRLTKSLADKGYIGKQAIGNKHNKNGNIYSLVDDVITSDIKSDTDSDKNDTLYNNRKEEKNIYVNSTTDVEYKPNLRQSEEIDDIPFDIDGAETETISEVKGIENDKPIYVNSTDSENMSYTDEELRAVNQQAVEEWKMMEETRHQHIGNQYKEVNEWVGKKLSRGYDLLGTFRQTKKQDAANAYAHEINKLIGSMNRSIQIGAITQKQAEAFSKFIDATNKAYEDKQKYFNRGEQMKRSKPQTVIENDSTSILNSDEEIEKAAPTPISITENDIKRMADEVIMCYYMLEPYSEVDEQNKKAISANGTPQLMRLYKELISQQI